MMSLESFFICSRGGGEVSQGCVGTDFWQVSGDGDAGSRVQCFLNMAVWESSTRASPM